jgi:hypothetical protein
MGKYKYKRLTVGIMIAQMFFKTSCNACPRYGIC